ncbi:hypothetical protein V3C99_007356 [Haemonchus contortus]
MDVVATFEIRLLASTLILIPAVIGLGLHFLLAFTLFRNWKTFHTVSFYVITVQTQWCDICALLLDLYVAFPLTLTGVQYMGDSIPLYYGPLFFEGIAFNGLFLLSFFLSLNRFLLFIFPHMHNRLFTYWGTRIMSLILWILVFLFIGFSNYFGCRKQFSKDDFYFWYNCSTQVPGEFHYNDFMHIVSNALPITMIVMYVIVFLKIRHLANSHGAARESSRAKQEIRYLMQTVLISLLIVVEVVAFFTVPFLGVTGYGQYYLNILLNLIIMSNNLVTPIVIFAYNPEIRRRLFTVVPNQKPITVAVVSRLF